MNTTILIDNQVLPITLLNKGEKGETGDKGEPGLVLVSSVNGKTGAVVLSHTDVGAEAAGVAQTEANTYTNTAIALEVTARNLAISSEAARAMDAENALSALITSLNTLLNNEALRALAAEGVLSEAIADLAETITVIPATKIQQEAATSNDVFVSPGNQIYSPLHPKAVCRFSTDTITTITFTYSITGTTCTVTKIDHKFIVGNWVYLNFTSGTGNDGWYEVESVINANVFTVTHITKTTSGGGEYYVCDLQYNPLSKITNVIKSNYTHFSVNLANPMRDSSNISATANGCKVALNLNDSSWEALGACVLGCSNYTPSGFLMVAADNNTDGDSNFLKYCTVLVFGELD